MAQKNDNLFDEEWVSFFYQCLSENLDYSTYCTARETGNTKQSKLLESKYPHVADLYNDLGTLFGWPDSGIQHESWREWFLPRRHLFIQDVQELSSRDVQPGHVRVVVPLLESYEDTRKLVELFLVDAYAAGVDEYAAAPKYKLHSKAAGKGAGKVVAVGYKQVKTALMTSYRYHGLDEDFELRDTTKAMMLEFLKQEFIALNWNMPNAVWKELNEQGTMHEAEFVTFRRLINQARSDFKLLSANAMHGRFPDLSLVDTSAVIDHFEMQ
jgi:hypothetical protein